MDNAFLQFCKVLLADRHLICSMAKREVTTQCAGSLLGIFWTFINPIILLTIFWVVFGIGFKCQPVENVPFVVWLTAGMSAWFFFAEIVTGSTTIIVAHQNLIKKTLFKSQVLPVIKCVSCMITHFVFLCILIILILFYHLPLSLYYFQVFYYAVCVVFLAIGIGWATASLHVFIRDTSQIVNAMIQIGMWATPIFWDINIMPANIRTLFKLNPLYYIVQGYRASFICFQPFWKHPYQTIYFWLFCIIVMVSGAIIFKKMQPHFADVL